MSSIWPSILLILAVGLLPVDWHYVNKISKSIKQKNGRSVVTYCKVLFPVTTVICTCFFIYTFVDAYSAHENISIALVFLKASWSIWALVVATVFSIKVFWKKGKQLEAEQANAEKDSTHGKL